MKKYFLLFIVLCVTAIVILLSTNKNSFKPKKNYVYIKNKQFFLNQQEFYPMVMNYSVSLQSDRKEFWPSPYSGYNTLNPYPFSTKDSSLIKLKTDMDLIKSMGFNTVRICKIGEPWLNKDKEGELSIGFHITNEGDSSIVLSKNNYSAYFNALDEMFKVINEAGLKVLLLLQMNPDFESSQLHLTKISERFKDEPTLMGYDFYNEPKYSDRSGRSKQEVFTIVTRWNKLLKQSAPNQLSTIGLEGLGEVFRWDPNILDLDFISYHPYEYEKGQVLNEIYWYGKHTEKPWIIGETAISADNDSISYKEQGNFAKITLEQTRNCGGSGYSWWQFKDVKEENYQKSYLGVVTNKERLKPVANIFKSYDPTLIEKKHCKCLENYYNLTPYNNFKLTGFLVDENNEPVEDGLIIAWNDSWSHSHKAISKADGSFELTSNFPFCHWMVSATKMTMVRDDLDPNTAKIANDSIPYVSIGKIKLSTLDFL